MKLETDTVRGYKSIAKLEAVELRNLVFLRSGYSKGLMKYVTGQMLVLAKLTDGGTSE